MNLSKILSGLNFKKPGLLTTALTHRSYLNEHPQSQESNERLEFLGDAVLELVVSDFLFQKYPHLSEGGLTNQRSKIVQTKTLAKVAARLGLPMALRISKGEAESGGRTNDSLLADTLEALIGAIYRDQGLPAATVFIKAHLLSNLEDILNSEEIIDYKSSFQETVQAEKLPTPSYQLVSESGPDHDKIFTMAVLVNGKVFTQGMGKTKQAAQQQAAKLALEKFKRKK